MPIISRLKPPDNRLERRIVTAMITNSDYLRQVKEIYRQNSLKLKFVKTIAEWCLEYYQEFKLCPGLHIQDIFHAKTKVNFQQETADEITDFLTEISEEYEQAGNLNVEYLLKQTEEHFRLCSLDDLRVSLNKSIISNNIEEGEALAKTYQRVVRQKTRGIDIFRDIDPLVETFSENSSNRVVLKFPGEFGRIVGDLEREMLVAFVGNTGVGKSWWLLQCAWWGVMSGQDVLYVSFEMSQPQIVTRSYQWVTGLPKKEGSIYIPQWDCNLNQNGLCPHPNSRTNKKSLISLAGTACTPDNYPTDYKPCTACQNTNNKQRFSFEPSTFMKKEKRKKLDLPSALKIRNLFDRINKRAGKFIFVRWPARSKSMDDLRMYLQNLEEYENIIPSILITDYANKMIPSQRYSEKRHGIEDVFIDHKSIAQERNILAITGHQGNTVRDGKDLKRGNWQEGVAGLNECDLSMMVNQKEQEKDSGLYRILLGKKRDDEYSATGQLWILNCLSIGRPYLDSWWGK